jgi:DNA polymerase-4
MRLPETIERLYLDFDGFFASVEQQYDPKLRDRPIGIVPFTNTERTCVIACSREAKWRGVKNVMTVPEARRLCPDILLVPQKPDLYRRAHNTLLAEIESVIPIDTVKSIDELTCKLDKGQRTNPQDLADKLKATLAEHVGKFITCSIGFAANRQLAKIAGKVDKPNGVTIWRPQDLPTPLFKVTFEEIPGVGHRMQRRLAALGIHDMEGLYKTQPKQMRQIWNNVTGERLWYALHGYDVQAPESERGMFGHSRVLPPESRTINGAYEICRLLLVKAARRMRRGRFYASGLGLGLSIRDGDWSRKRTLPAVRDDKALLEALEALFGEVRREYPKGMTIFSVSATLYDLTPNDQRQMDMLLDDDAERQRFEAITDAMDRLNTRFARTVVSLGPWNPPAGGHIGGKISYCRIPDAEDFQ